MVLGSILLESIPLLLRVGIGTTDTLITVISWTSHLIYNKVYKNKPENLNDQQIKNLVYQVELLTYEIKSIKDEEYYDKVIEF